MKPRSFTVFSILMLFIFTGCGDHRRSKEYSHAQAGFKITIPGGWNKTGGDSEMYEFRSGNLKLIEVGGFDLPVGVEVLYGLPSDEFLNTLKQATLDGLDGYCEEARITGYRINEQYETMWGGEPAYRVQASGYSNEALASMVVDIVALVYREKARMYMFISQIEEASYSRTKYEIEGIITSFQLLR
jgi:hypothetical protein